MALLSEVGQGGEVRWSSKRWMEGWREGESEGERERGQNGGMGESHQVLIDFLQL